MAYGVQGGGHGAYALDGLLDVGGDFVDADEEDHVLGAEYHAGHPVANHVRVHELSLLREGVRAGEEEVGFQGLAPPVGLLRGGVMVAEGLDEHAVRAFLDFFQDSGRLHRHGVAPGDAGRFDFGEDGVKKHFAGLVPILCEEHFEIVFFQCLDGLFNDFCFHSLVFGVVQI